jgi:transcriptional regulator
LTDRSFGRIDATQMFVPSVTYQIWLRSEELSVPGRAAEALGCQLLFRTVQRSFVIYSFAGRKGGALRQSRTEILQGTLDLIVLKALVALGPLHGYGIARRIEQVSEEMLRLNEGTVYQALLRLQQKGWITSEWGLSENNRRARFYSATKVGRKQLERETESWNRVARIMGNVLKLRNEV